MIIKKSPITQPEMKYSDYIKLLGYLSENCNDKDYHMAIVKLDKFHIVIEG